MSQSRAVATMEPEDSDTKMMWACDRCRSRKVELLHSNMLPIAYVVCQGSMQSWLAYLQVVSRN